MERTSIRILPNGKGGYVVVYYDTEPHAKLEAGDCIDDCCLTAFDVQCHSGEIAILSILLQDGKPKAISTLED